LKLYYSITAAVPSKSKGDYLSAAS
jgi:hypothetical protein